MFEKYLPDGNDRAVSPVIGVVLMVGIVVALGAVVGAAVLGLGVGVGDTAPNAQFDATYQINDGGPNDLVVEHVAGDTVDADRINGSFADASYDDTASTVFSGEVTAGSTATYTETTSGDFAEDTFSIQWQSENGETSSVLFEYDVPAE